MKSRRHIANRKLQLRSMIMLSLFFTANVLTLVHFSNFSHSVDLRTGELLEAHQQRDPQENPSAANPRDERDVFATIDEACDHIRGAHGGQHHGKDETCAFAQALRNSVVIGHTPSDVIGFDIPPADIQIPVSIRVVSPFPLFLLARKNSPPRFLA